MAIKVRIPTALRGVTGGQPEVTAEGANVIELLKDLEARYPGFGSRVFGQDGNINRYMNIFVNDEDIRFLQGQETGLSDGDEVSIIPAIAGGAN